MKEIRAYIQPYMLNKVTQALMEIPEFPGMSVIPCEGFGHDRIDIGKEIQTFFPKQRIEIFAPDVLADVIFDTLMKAAHTGHHGDGKVYMLEVLRAGRISNGQYGLELI